MKLQIPAKGRVDFLRKEESRRRDAGRALRQEVPRLLHAQWDASKRSLDPLTLLQAQGQSRLQDLIPLRYGRMSHSPFTYMRGAAAMMAADVALNTLTGIRGQACGDCHLGNFGAFASPERRVIFDINDFDETLPASWEYDVKRLAVSFVLQVRDLGQGKSESQAVNAKMLASYREHSRAYARMSPVERWYALIDSEVLIRTARDEATRKRRIAFEQKARNRTADSLLGKLLSAGSDDIHFIDAPPTLTHLPHDSGLEKAFRSVLQRYPQTLSQERRQLLSQYQLVDVARKVVGVGSVGTRCGVGLYIAPGGHWLVLQVKEANASVLAPYAGQGLHEHQGERVVYGQKLMQCASDIFLGWATDDEGRHYYVRQLRDMKTSVPYESLQGEVLFNFAEMCGWALARAHAKSGGVEERAAYIGKSDALDAAISAFAEAYSDQTEKDFAIFKSAIRQGKLPIEYDPK